jgi:hypothetical protein
MIFRKIVVHLESFVVLMDWFFLLIFGTFVRIYIFTFKELEDVVIFLEVFVNFQMIKGYYVASLKCYCYCFI